MILSTAAWLYLAVALFALVFAAKYALAQDILGYHRAMLKASVTSVTPGTRIVLLAQYRLIAAAFVSVGIALGVIAVFGVSPGQPWSQPAALVVGLVTTLPPTHVGWQAERATGVRTPWRQGLLGIALTVAAAVASFLQ